MVSNGILHSLIRKGPVPWRSQEYLIYPEKFLHRTWDLLGHAGIAKWIREESDYGVPAAVGLLMMSVLADVCAGSQLQKITDLAQAYAWLAQQHASLLDSQYVTNLDVSQIAPDQDRLAMISPEVLDARKVPIEKLVALRRREAKANGSDLKAMRRRFAKATQDHIERIGKEARTANDGRHQYQCIWNFAQPTKVFRLHDPLQIPMDKFSSTARQPNDPRSSTTGS